MGWYGDYDNTNEVIEKISNDFKILDYKCLKSYGCCLYEHKETGEKNIDYFIFKDGMYKTIHWVEGGNRIPKRWINEIKPFMNEYTKELYKEEMQRQAKKRKKPKLDDILEKGKKYKIFGKYEATYIFKEKRTHIFNYDGELTKFVGLNTDNVEVIT